MWPFHRKAADDASDDSLGRRGEKIAVAFLKKRGFNILAVNYRCPAGEADIIALDRSTRESAGMETIAFVEVKARASDRHTRPQDAVNADKQRRLRNVARYYLASRDASGFSPRFDILAVVAPPGAATRVEYIPNAFE